MQNSSLPLVLCFGASDPTGATGIQADLSVCGSFGCHGLSVMTRLLVQDTVSLEASMPIDSEWVIDQARCLLEDGRVSVFKVGDVGSTENVAAIAEVVSDYPDIALVLAPNPRQNSEGLLVDEEEMNQAIAELLVPQSSVLVAKHALLEHYASDYLEDIPNDSHTVLARILGIGCEYVLATDNQEQSIYVSHGLYKLDERGAPALLRRDQWDRLPYSFSGTTDTLASAIAALLANGLDVTEAIVEAQEYLQQALLAGYRMGMGKLMLDRLFWARYEEEEPPSLH